MIIYAWWIFAAIIGYLIGVRRGRPVVGIIYSVLLGPLGWLLTLLLVEDRRPRCPHCREVIQAGAMVCARCRQPTVRSAAAEHAAWRDRADDPVDRWAREQQARGVDPDVVPAK